MSVRVYAAIFGVLFIIIGILGYLPNFAPEGNLLYLFTVNSAQNIFHIVTGIFGLLVAFSSYYARMYFRVFGIIYLFIGVLAILVGSDFVYMRLNAADNLFHLIIGALYVYFGFGKPKDRFQKGYDTRGARVVPETDRVEQDRVERGRFERDRFERGDSSESDRVERDRLESERLRHEEKRGGPLDEATTGQKDRNNAVHVDLSENKTTRNDTDNK